MKRSTRNPEKTRQAILEKAATVFNKYGYAGCKMDMIIKATGYQKGGIYNHFTSKKELAIAAFQYNFNSLKQGILQEMEKATTPVSKLLALIKVYQKFTTAAPVKGGCPILNLASEVDDTDEAFRLVVQSAFIDASALLERVLIEGITLGEFNPNIDAKKETLFIIATLEGSIMIASLNKNAGMMLAIIDNLIGYIQYKIFIKEQLKE